MKKTSERLFPESLTIDLLQSESKNTFSDFLGVTFTEIGPDFMTATMKVEQKHLRPGGIMHGGVSLALIETVGSVAARCTLGESAVNTLGIQVSASHLAIARPGDILKTTAHALHVGRTTQAWDVTIQNNDGKTVSSGRITLLVVSKS